MRPVESQSGVPSLSRINARDWYGSPLLSTASVRPRHAASAVASFAMIGMRSTPPDHRALRVVAFRRERAVLLDVRADPFRAGGATDIFPLKASDDS